MWAGGGGGGRDGGGGGEEGDGSCSCCFARVARSATSATVAEAAAATMAAEAARVALLASLAPQPPAASLASRRRARLAAPVPRPNRSVRPRRPPRLDALGSPPPFLAPTAPPVRAARLDSTSFCALRSPRSACPAVYAERAPPSRLYPRWRSARRSLRLAPLGVLRCLLPGKATCSACPAVFLQARPRPFFLLHKGIGTPDAAADRAQPSTAPRNALTRSYSTNHSSASCSAMSNERSERT